MFPGPLLLLARMFCSCQAKHPLMDSSNRGMLLSLLGPRGDSVKLESFREVEIFDTVTLPAYDYERALRFLNLSAIFMVTSTANVVLIWANLS